MEWNYYDEQKSWKKGFSHTINPLQKKDVSEKSLEFDQNFSFRGCRIRVYYWILPIYFANYFNIFSNSISRTNMLLFAFQSFFLSVV